MARGLHQVLETGPYVCGMLRPDCSWIALLQGTLTQYAQWHSHQMARGLHQVLETGPYVCGIPRLDHERRKASPTLDVGELVYLSTKNLTLLKGRARKLLPKYIGPMKVVVSHLETNNYMLELPQQLKD